MALAIHRFTRETAHARPARGRPSHRSAPITEEVELGPDGVSYREVGNQPKLIAVGCHLPVRLRTHSSASRSRGSTSHTTAPPP
jgi:hypothetical protein